MRDKTVYEQFFEYQYGFKYMISKIAYPFVNDAIIAEDIVIESLEIAMSQNITWKDINHLTGYVGKVVRNESINYRSYQARDWKNKANMIRQIDTYEDPNETIERKIRTEFVNELINGLPPRCALVFRLYYIEEIPLIKIRELLDLKGGAVKTQHARGLELLRKKLGTTKEKYLENCRALAEKIKNSSQYTGTARLYGVKFGTIKALRSGKTKRVLQ